MRFCETMEADTNEVYRVPSSIPARVLDVYGSTIVGTDAVGVSQFYVESLANAPTDSRLMSVATSGLLLVEADSAVAATIAVGSQLTLDAVGRAAAAGTAITIAGKVPAVREVLVGQRSFVLVAS